MSDEEKSPCETDYQVGADILVDVFEGPLKKQLLQFEFKDAQVILKIAKYEIVFLVDKKNTSPETVKFLETNKDANLLIQVSDVRDV
jgi:hypothetical protein